MRETLGNYLPSQANPSPARANMYDFGKITTSDANGVAAKAKMRVKLAAITSFSELLWHCVAYKKPPENVGGQ